MTEQSLNSDFNPIVRGGPMAVKPTEIAGWVPTHHARNIDGLAPTLQNYA
jgi:hypothetical protein